MVRVSRRIRPVSWLAALLAGLVLAGLTVLPASAHAELGDSQPANGALLANPPKDLALTFTEPVKLPPQGVRVFDSSGRQVTTAASSVDNKVEVTFGADTTVAGTYVVSWRVVSQDGHPVDGAFTFSVGEATRITSVPTVAEASTGLTLALRIGNALTDAGLLLAAGLGVFLVFLLPGGPGTVAVRHRLLRVQTVAAVVALAATVVIIALLRLWQDAATLADLARPETWAGLLTLNTVAPPIMVASGLGVAVLGGRRSSGWMVLGGGAVALASLVINGHTRAYGPSWLSYPLDLLHVSAGALWLGALVGLGMLAAKRSGAGATDVATATSRFSGLALESIVVLSAAGVILMSLIIDSPRDLIETTWGLTLIIKVAAVAAVLVVAALNRWRILPTVRRLVEHNGDGAALTWLRRCLRIEAVGLAVVLAVTGVLTTQSPVAASPVDSLPTAGPTSQRLVDVQPLGDGTISFAFEPVRRGQNTVTVELRDAVDEPFSPAVAPTLETTYPRLQLGPLQQKLTRTGPGAYQATVDLQYAGDWELTYRIRLDKFTEATPVYPVTIS